VAWLNTNLGSEGLPPLCSCKPSETYVPINELPGSLHGWPSMGLWENLFIPSCPHWESLANVCWQPLLDSMNAEMRKFKAKTGYGILWAEEM